MCYDTGRELQVVLAESLTVYNTLGQRVATLVDGEMDAGSHQVKFDATGLASGVYFYRLQAGSYLATKKPPSEEIAPSHSS